MNLERREDMITAHLTDQTSTLAPAGCAPTLAVAATFTAEPLQDALGFWVRELGQDAVIEFAPYNISVNTVTPGHPMHTSMSEITYSAEQRRIWKDPAEPAPAFVHLALQDANGLNDRHVRAWDLVVELREKGMSE